jgi:hypothetical protein
VPTVYVCFCTGDACKGFGDEIVHSLRTLLVVVLMLACGCTYFPGFDKFIGKQKFASYSIP